MSAISLSVNEDSAQSTANSSNISIQETLAFDGGEGSEHRARDDEERTTGLYAIEHTVSVHVLSMAFQQFRGDMRSANRHT